MAAIMAGTISVGAALTLVESVGLVLAIAFWTVAALLFGNWYRTSTKRVELETEATAAGPKVDGFSVYWTRDSAESDGVPAASQPVDAAR